MSKFKVGQEVVCIKRDHWITRTGEITTGPIFNEICTITGIFNDGRFYEGPGVAITLEEHYGRFSITRFAPLITTSQLEKELESITKTIEV